MSSPVIELKDVSKRFGKSFDLAARLTRSARRAMGAALPDQTVRAVDHVDITNGRASSATPR